jgi:hypothetical protein
MAEGGGGGEKEEGRAERQDEIPACTIVRSRMQRRGVGEEVGGWSVQGLAGQYNSGQTGGGAMLCYQVLVLHETIPQQLQPILSIHPYVRKKCNKAQIPLAPAISHLPTRPLAGLYDPPPFAHSSQR